jgi:hypothetical protein
MNYVTELKLKEYILSCVDGSNYGVEFTCDLDKMRFLKETFYSEKGHEVARYGIRKPLVDWFQGLTSACTVAFENYEILIIATELGFIPEDATEVQEDAILVRWFDLVAGAAMQLFRGI